MTLKLWARFTEDQARGLDAVLKDIGGGTRSDALRYVVERHLEGRNNSAVRSLPPELVAFLEALVHRLRLKDLHEALLWSLRSLIVVSEKNGDRPATTRRQK